MMPEQSAAKAKALLQQAITALGGQAYLSVRNSECTGRGALFGHSGDLTARRGLRSEEHTSELQSLAYLVCRLLLEKKKNKTSTMPRPPYATHCVAKKQASKRRMHPLLFLYGSLFVAGSHWSYSASTTVTLPVCARH